MTDDRFIRELDQQIQKAAQELAEEFRYLMEAELDKIPWDRLEGLAPLVDYCPPNHAYLLNLCTMWVNGQPLCEHEECRR